MLVSRIPGVFFLLQYLSCSLWQGKCCAIVVPGTCSLARKKIGRIPLPSSPPYAVRPRRSRRALITTVIAFLIFLAAVYRYRERQDLLCCAVQFCAGTKVARGEN